MATGSGTITWCFSLVRKAVFFLHCWLKIGESFVQAGAAVLTFQLQLLSCNDIITLASNPSNYFIATMAKKYVLMLICRRDPTGAGGATALHLFASCSFLWHEISILTKLLMYPFAISTSTFQPNLRGPLDCLASMLGMACRRNRRWHLDSSPGKCIICSVSASTSAGVKFSQYFQYHHTSKPSQPFEGCFSFVKDITDFLEKLITWPRDCGRAIGDCATRCPTPF